MLQSLQVFGFMLELLDRQQMTKVTLSSFLSNCSITVEIFQSGPN